MPENGKCGSSVTVSVLCEDEGGIAEIKATLDGEAVSLDENNEYIFIALPTSSENAHSALMLRRQAATAPP